MAFFKFRPGANASSEESAAGADIPSVDLLRRKAQQRLIGATVLVVLAVAGFPMVFDTQPRPVPVDLSIDIPSKSKVNPDTPPAPLKPVPGLGRDDTKAGTADDAKSSLTDKEELVSTSTAEKPAQAPMTASGNKPESVKPEPLKPEAVKPEPLKPEAVKPESNKPESAVAAVVKDDPVPASSKSATREHKSKSEASESRYVVQVGAYSEESRLREVRAKLEKAGLKTYTQVIETKEGRRTRVRLGPFASKAEADKAVEKIKGLHLPAAILTL